jgi:hypothetical protein
MGRLALLVAVMISAAGSGASAQMFTRLPNSCQKFSGSAVSADHDVIYLRAACVAARAGVASPANGRLSREELMSILMLMSLQQPSKSHIS